MRNYLLLIVLFITVGFSISCSDDSEPDPHEVGVWVLKEYATIDVPPGFESNEGITYEVSEITFGGIIISNLELDLKSDGTFLRTISIDGVLPETDEGTWNITDETLILTLDDDSEQTFSIEKNIGDEFWYSVPSNFNLIPDATRAEWATTYPTSEEFNAYVDSLTEEEFQALFQLASLKLVNVFERKQ